MTALHWLAYNNDHMAIMVLLEGGADHLTTTHDGLLPIDVAGTTPSLKSVDVLLEHYSRKNDLPKPRAFHNDFSAIEKFLDFDTQIPKNSSLRRAGDYVQRGEVDLDVEMDMN